MQRLSLIKLILVGFNPDEQYNKLKKINNDINELKYIKDNILIYYKDFYQDNIIRIIEVIKNNQNKKIIEYKEGRIRDLIKETEDTEDLKELADKINEVKNLLLFNVIYDMNSGKNENKNFENSYETLEKIEKYLKDSTNIIELNNNYRHFKKTKENLSNNEDEANDIIKKFEIYFNINNTNFN